MKKETLILVEMNLVMAIVLGLILMCFDGAVFIIGIVLLALTAAVLVGHITFMVIGFYKNRTKPSKVSAHERSQQARMGKADLVKNLIDDQQQRWE